MAKFLDYLWPVLIAIYIISPLDAHPLLWDDLIAAGLLLYLLFRKTGHRRRQHADHYSRSQQNRSSGGGGSPQALTLEDAYALLGVSPDASWEEINRAYREKMARSHPDKVSHLSEELQEKAEEITRRLNEAIDMIKRSKGK
ncbi:MAG: DnaJ domain-containing protein [Deferribacteres bacterium]|nr:DnaJ domain-containing protein [Deferribacteres bacterium]